METEAIPNRPGGHRQTCGCLACADWRAWYREQVAGRRGWRPRGARDWRGVELAS